MHTRDTRYELRFETGKRSGERHPLPLGAHVLGRATDCDVRIHDASVSSRHAELIVTEDEVQLVDLDSTNGTRVGGKRIDSARLAHGDLIALGQAELVLRDERFGDASGNGQSTTTETVRSVQPAAPSRGRWTGFLLMSLALASIGFFAFTRWKAQADNDVAQVVKTVIDVPGNLLSDPSFEAGEETQWDTPSAAPRAFRQADRFAATGSFGIGVELGVDEWSTAISESLPVAGMRAVRVRASLRALDTAGAASMGTARLGLERVSADGRLWRTWAATVAGNDDFELLDAIIPVAPGWDEIRVVLAVRGPGEFAADDVSVVRADAPSASVRFLENDVVAGSDRSSSLAVIRGGRTVAEMALSGWQDGRLLGPGTGYLQALATENGLSIEVHDCGSEESASFAIDVRGEDPWFVTLGTDGFRSRSQEFDGKAVTDVVVGAGIETLRIRFATPRSLRGRLEGDTLRLQAPVQAGDLIDLQLRFREDVTRGNLLREQALEAAASNRPARALAHWTELLGSVPFQSGLVREAQETSSRLIQDGLERVEQVRRAVQRARFFSLPDLFRGTLSDARDLAVAYEGTEVESAARTLIVEIEAELADFDAEETQARLRQLQSILESRAVSGSPALTGHLERALDDWGRDH